MIEYELVDANGEVRVEPASYQECGCYLLHSW